LIYEKDGRVWSIQTEKEMRKALEKELKTLTPEEQETLRLMMEELQTSESATEEATILNALTRAEYKTPLVSMQQFLEDPYYLGDTCGDLYKKWREVLSELFEGGIYHEVIFTGSIGSGKTFCAAVGLIRTIYELSCMKNPQKSFGLADKSQIAIASLSVNEGLAIKVVLENIAVKLAGSPYFKENFPPEILKKEIKFPNNIWVTARATTDTSALGLNIIAGIIDESNFLNRNKGSARQGANANVDRAETIYTLIKRRMKSRFERRGKLPGILFLVSSKQTEDDFTAKRLREAKESGDPHIFCADFALWDVKPEAYANGRFKVLVGSEATFSRILDEKEEELYSVKANLPEGSYIIDVPEEFRADFERDLEGSLRDLGGVSTLSVTPFIQRREKIVDAIDSTRIHPFSSISYDSSKGGSFRWDLMVRPAMAPSTGLSNYTGKTVPILNPSASRAIHFDPSINNDNTGVCMAHIGGWKDVKRRAPDGTEYLERAPVYVVDFVLQIVPPVGGEIVLADNRQIVYDLSAHGYTITSITIDGHQSTDTIQQLSAQGYNAVYQSIDKKMDPYETLKMALYENRVIYYDYPPLLKELRKLQVNWIKGKVDHPAGAGGSKDCADALAGAVYALSGMKLNTPLPIMSSISHYPGNTESSPSSVNTIIPTTPADPQAAKNRSSYNVLPPFLIGDGSDGRDGSGF